ncbi:hypothetical protein ACIQ9R_36360 [Streptomyces sp. NPDC094447]|uniref:hypothetical protein n=1 Tax=Streptomyces sp. NPDC094447 TaxID=3366062 RepID=UPI00381F0F87
MNPSRRQVAAARLAAAEAARATADLARAVVGETSSQASAEDRIRAARRLRVLSLEVLDWTIRSEFLNGVPWEELAGYARRDAETLRRQYEAGTLQWVASLPESTESEADAADTLDGWYRRHAEELLDPAHETPVGGLFTPPGSC